MEEAEQLCDRIAIMDRGRVVACDTPRALIQQLGADATVRATVQHGSIAGEDLWGLEAVVAAELHDRDGSQSFELRTTDAQVTLTALLHLAQRQHVTLSGLSTAQASLEDVFLARTGHRYEGDEDEQ
jgi:ABC-2 type transport system ATP-binding protein